MLSTSSSSSPKEIGFIFFLPTVDLLAALLIVLKYFRLSKSASSTFTTKLHQPLQLVTGENKNQQHKTRDN
jgi:hypothetical protein